MAYNDLATVICLNSTPKATSRELLSGSTCCSSCTVRNDRARPSSSDHGKMGQKPCLAWSLLMGATAPTKAVSKQYPGSFATYTASGLKVKALQPSSLPTQESQHWHLHISKLSRAATACVMQQGELTLARKELLVPGGSCSSTPDQGLSPSS